ncbi:MAG: universal stress protein, partial [Calditrichaeota bacterium]|nr:universal stress protein [Calditrichota bacterium]
MKLDYRKVAVAVDGSQWSSWAEDWAVAAARAAETHLLGVHVYAARLHRVRFEQMEPGLPEPYQGEEKLGELRGTHDSLITDGLKLISDAYLQPVQGKAAKAGVPFEAATPEGRNYVEILKLVSREKVDLLVLGAKGLGAAEEDDLGSVAERVLLHAGCDVLIVRTPFPEAGQGVFCGVDGSDASFQAARRAATWAETLGAPLTLAAVFDPAFHTGVFRTIARVLPEEVSQRFDFQSQERLHDEIIDRGLENLYASYLTEAAEVVGDGHAGNLERRVLKGKPYRAVLDELAPGRASLLVVGRYGRHR